MLYFENPESNYNQQNMVDIITYLSSMDNTIYEIMNSSFNYILVSGDVHKSQFLAENKGDNYWITIKAFSGNHKPIPGYKAIHIFLCFKQMTYDYMSNQYYFTDTCINPPKYKGTDIADISNLMGIWQYVNHTYGIKPKQYYQEEKNRPTVVKREKKRLEIIDPKTGKPIKLGGGKQKGGSKERKRRKLISLKNPIISYFKFRGKKR
jgi:hypothetical protein